MTVSIMSEKLHAYNIYVFWQSIEKKIRSEVDDAIAQAKVRSILQC